MICAGGGGIPVVRGRDGKMEGVEAVIDKDRASALLARALEADVLLMLTNVEAVFRDWGVLGQTTIARITPDALATMQFSEGSMGSKITAACDFGRTGGKMAGIGRFQDARSIVEERAGTRVRMEPNTVEIRLPSPKNAAQTSNHQPEAVQGSA